MKYRLKFFIILFLFIPSLSFSQVTSMRDYPINNSPNTSNDTLLGIDEQQDAVNWEVNNFSFSGILSWIKANSGEYLESAADFTVAHEIITATGTGKITQSTPVQIDQTGAITNVTSMAMNPSPDPGMWLLDSDAPGSNKEVAFIGGQYISGGAGSENADLFFNATITGSRSQVSRFDVINGFWVFPYDITVPDEIYGAGWNGSLEVPTKNAVYDQIESISAGGEANDLADVGVGEGTLRAGKSGVNLQIKSLQQGSNITITNNPNEVVISANIAGGSSEEAAWHIYDSDVAVQVGDGKQAFSVPVSFNGLDLIDLLCTVHDQGVTGTTDIQLRRRRAGADVDMLTTPVTIAAQYYANDGVINPTNDDLATGDRIYVDIDAIHTGTAPNGLGCVATFQ